MRNADLRATDCDAIIDQFWSEVQDEVAAPRHWPSADVPAESAKSSVLRSLMGRWMVAAVLVAGVTLAGQSVFRLTLGSSATGASTAAAFGAVGDLRAAFSGDAVRQTAEEMPAELVIYGERQFRNFRRDIQRFTDADLLQYAVATTRDMQGVSKVMTPYLLDALFLTHAEIARRGLQRPQVTALVDAQRARYQAQPRGL